MDSFTGNEEEGEVIVESMVVVVVEEEEEGKVEDEEEAVDEGVRMCISGPEGKVMDEEGKGPMDWSRIPWDTIDERRIRWVSLSSSIDD